MTRRIIPPIAALAAACSPIALPALAHAAEPSAAAMFRGGPQETGVYAGPAPRSIRGIRFMFRTGGPIRGTATVSDGVLYLGSTDGNLYAIDALTGAERWRFHSNGPISSSPAVVDGLVYFTSRDGSLYALAARDGRQRWKVDLGPDLGDQDYWDFYTSSPTPFGNSLYVGSGAGFVYAIDRRSGHVQWRTNVGARVRSTPAVTDRDVVFGTMSGHVAALDRATGAVRWRFATEGASHTFETRNNDTTSVFASPTIADGVVTVGGRDAMLYGLDLATGRELWHITHDGSSWILSTAAADGIVYSGSGSAFIAQAADLRTGAERWRFRTGFAVFGSPAIAGDVLLLDDLGGLLHAVDRADGRELWHFQLGDRAFSSPVVANGIVYAAADNGILYAIDTAAEAMPARPELRRLVYAEPPSDAAGFHYFTPEVAQANLAQFKAAGYRQVDAAQLREAMTDQIAHPEQRTCLVFADNMVPEDALAPSTDQAPLRRFLEAGGTVVFLGDDPTAFVRDPSTHRVTQVDPELPQRLLGLHYPPINRDRGWHVSYVTAEGRRLGLPETFVATSPILADQVGEVLARDEFGLATEWTRNYGQAGRLIQLAAPRRSVSDLQPLIRAIELIEEGPR